MKFFAIQHSQKSELFLHYDVDSELRYYAPLVDFGTAKTAECFHSVEHARRMLKKSHQRGFKDSEYAKIVSIDVAISVQVSEGE